MARLQPNTLAASLQSLLICPRAAPPRMPTRPATTRLFTTSTPRPTKTIQATWIPKQLVPPYPYGERLVYKQSNKGLYGQARIRFGNNVAKHKLNPIKTRRVWKVNVHYKRLWSNALRAWVRTRVSTRVLRTVRKCGGLDEYLMGSKTRRIRDLGPTGWRLRWLVLQSERMVEKLAEERRRLGLDVEDGVPLLPPGKDPAVERAELLKIACDYATPGPLSRATRDIIDKRQREAAAGVVDATQTFSLGEEVADLGEGADTTTAEEAYEYETMPHDEAEALGIRAAELEARRSAESGVKGKTGEPGTAEGNSPNEALSGPPKQLPETGEKSATEEVEKGPQDPKP